MGHKAWFSSYFLQPRQILPSALVAEDEGLERQFRAPGNTIQGNTHAKLGGHLVQPNTTMLPRN